MKLAMAISTAIGGPKLQIRQQFREQHEQQERTIRVKSRVRLFRELIRGARRLFVFLLIATVAVFIWAHYTDINAVARQPVRLAAKPIKDFGNASRLRQNTLNYEKEVNEIDNN